MTLYYRMLCTVLLNMQHLFLLIITLNTAIFTMYKLCTVSSERKRLNNPCSMSEFSWSLCYSSKSSLTLYTDKNRILLRLNITHNSVALQV